MSEDGAALPSPPTCQLTSGCKLIVSGPGVGEANSCHSSEVMIQHPHTGMLFGSKAKGAFLTKVSIQSMLRVRWLAETATLFFFH